MDLNLKQRVVIVTGGARGIGRATAERFKAEGAHVFVWDLPDVDVTRPESIEKATADIVVTMRHSTP